MNVSAAASLPIKQLERLLKLDLSAYSKTIYNLLALSLILSLVGFGFVVKEEEILTAENGLGYWLGIIGGSLMLLLVIYPIRKQLKTARFIGSVRFWFKTHMLFGVMGPIAILYHSNFSTGSLNSTVALYCMLIVASSGFIGRYFYSRIHYGLYGKKASLQDLVKTIEDDKGKLQIIYAITPELKTELSQIQVSFAQDLSLLQSLKRFVVTGSKIRFKSIFLPSRMKRIVKAHAKEHKWSKQHTSRYLKIINRYTRHYLNTILKVYEFSIYERLFALWHTLHLPLFLMMIITGIIHVVAVHMY